MSGTRYASGKYAIGICDRCGLQSDYLELRKERQTKEVVCSDCLDDPYPFWALRARRPDPENLRHPRPETELSLPEDES